MGRLSSGVRAIWRLLLMLGLAGVVGIGALVVVDWQARSNDEVYVIEVPFLAGSSGLTTGRVIFVYEGRAEDAELLAHELVHVCQWEVGQVEFLWDYTTEYGSNLAELGDAKQAYREISFEEQARAGDSDCDFSVYVVP